MNFLKHTWCCKLSIINEEINDYALFSAIGSGLSHTNLLDKRQIFIQRKLLLPTIQIDHISLISCENSTNLILKQKASIQTYMYLQKLNGKARKNTSVYFFRKMFSYLIQCGRPSMSRWSDGVVSVSGLLSNEYHPIQQKRYSHSVTAFQKPFNY